MLKSPKHLSNPIIIFLRFLNLWNVNTNIRSYINLFSFLGFYNILNNYSSLSRNFSIYSSVVSHKHKLLQYDLLTGSFGNIKLRFKILYYPRNKNHYNRLIVPRLIKLSAQMVSFKKIKILFKKNTKATPIITFSTIIHSFLLVRVVTSFWWKSFL